MIKLSKKKLIDNISFLFLREQDENIPLSSF